MGIKSVAIGQGPRFVVAMQKPCPVLKKVFSKRVMPREGVHFLHNSDLLSDISPIVFCDYKWRIGA